MPAQLRQLSPADAHARACSAPLPRGRALALRVYVPQYGAALAGVWLACSVAGHAQAAPSLRVRAQPQLELHTLGSASGARIAGSLRDDLGSALPNRTLLMTAEGVRRARTLVTDAEGRFEAASPCGPESACRVSVELEGDAFYEHTLVGHLVEPQKAEVRLEISEPASLKLDLDRPETQVRVRASSALGGASLPVTLEDELGRELARGVTTADGSVGLRVDSAALGGAGLGELVARTSGDASRTAAYSSKAVLRSSSTRASLAAHQLARARGVTLSVQLQSARGPIAQRALGIFEGERHLTTLITDARGLAARTASLEELGLQAGEHRLVARFASDLPGLGASESEAVRLVIEMPGPPSSLWLALPALASAALAFWSMRRKQAGPAAAEAVALREPEVRLGAIVRSRGPQLACSGRVADADTEAGLEALLELEHESGSPGTVHCDEAGYFASGELAAGKYRVRVLAQGYASIAFELEVPHYGSGSDLRISLRSLRGLALDTYAQALSRTLPAPRAQVSTVREALTAAVSCGRGGASVRDLAHATERIAYARPIPFESDLRDLQRAAASAASELGDLSPPPKDPELGR